VVDITRGMMSDARTSLLPPRCLSSTCGELMALLIIFKYYGMWF
jgi:hypothetical protein